MIKIYFEICCYTADAHLVGRDKSGECFAGVVVIGNEGSQHRWQLSLGKMSNPEAYMVAILMILVKMNTMGITDGLGIYSVHDVSNGWLTGRYGIKQKNIRDIFKEIKSVAKLFDSVDYFVADKRDENIIIAKILARGKKTTDS